MNASDFRAAMEAHGLIPPEVIEPGRLYRFPGVDKRNGNTAGWCKLFDDGLGGSFGDWASGFSENWQAKRDRQLSTMEREAFKQHVAEARAQAEAERKARQVEAATKAEAIWSAATPAPADHRYLVRKGINAHGARLHNGALVIPVRSAGELHSLQFINADGSKRFLSGGQISGGYFSLGDTQGAAALCLTEGFATGVTVHQATGHPVAVAFNAGNMKAVAQALRARFPALPLIICADDDAGTEGNPGLSKANDAARVVGGQLAVPTFGPERPTGASDFNDMAAVRGMDAVREAINNATSPPGDKAVNAGATQLWEPRVELIDMSTLNPQPIDWLWSGWLARGKLHILAGAPSTGKTTLALALAATITCGGQWPDRSRSEIGRAVIWSGEDDTTDTLLPRLLAAGADTHRVHIVGTVSDENGPRAFDPGCDIDKLEHALMQLPELPNLLIIDPIVSAVAGDSHKNAETRRALAPLVNLAQRTGCALVGITHFTKGTAGREPLERVTGSLAFGALARVVLATVRRTDDHPDGPARLLVRAKSNIGPDGGGFHYQIEEEELRSHAGLCATRATWGAPIEGTARTLMASAEADQGDGEQSASDEAADFLRQLLKDGPIKAREGNAQAKELGLSAGTLCRARQKLGVIVSKAEFGGGWTWELPPEDSKFHEDSKIPTVEMVESSAVVESSPKDERTAAPNSREGRL